MKHPCGTRTCQEPQRWILDAPKTSTWEIKQIQGNEIFVDQMKDKEAFYLANMTHMSSDATAEAIWATTIIKEDNIQKIIWWSSEPRWNKT